MASMWEGHHRGGSGSWGQVMAYLRDQKGWEAWTHALSWCLHGQECMGQGLGRRVRRLRSWRGTEHIPGH